MKLKVDIAPVQLLKSGSVWVHTDTYLMFSPISEMPEEFHGKNLAEVFAEQQAQGVSHDEELITSVMNAREGVGWLIWLPQKGIRINGIIGDNLCFHGVRRRIR